MHKYISTMIENTYIFFYNIIANNTLIHIIIFDYEKALYFKCILIKFNVIVNRKQSI